MSHASNKVHWCLHKAKRELEEIGVHRGLVTVEPDDKLAALHITKATHNLNAALFFGKNNYSDWSASAFFYCVYHCFLAILRKFGYESKNQECTIAAMEMLKEQGRIDIEDRLISTLKMTQARDDGNIIKLREDFQYGTAIEFQRKEEFEKLTLWCKEAIEATNRIVFNGQ